MMEIVSVDDPGRALKVLRAERERRTVFAWKCKGGRIIPVAGMDDNHLANTIAMLERAETERGIVEENRGEVFG